MSAGGVFNRTSSKVSGFVSSVNGAERAGGGGGGGGGGEEAIEEVKMKSSPKIVYVFRESESKVGVHFHHVLLRGSASSTVVDAVVWSALV